ncbi:hypothetical protein WN51_03802 [Melipona quadrifasciata]|uniref:Uncharacterized protein n=1 Tax=Melipona quadrifasciata TaxID=166423 RepID=A0A0M8ZUN6_9HYME|nr:hypothetical protein WN51_03802 [Melipona quadrifasciata]
MNLKENKLQRSATCVLKNNSQREPTIRNNGQRVLNKRAHTGCPSSLKRQRAKHDTARAWSRLFGNRRGLENGVKKKRKKEEREETIWNRRFAWGCGPRKRAARKLRHNTSRNTDKIDKGHHERRKSLGGTKKQSAGGEVVGRPSGEAVLELSTLKASEDNGLNSCEQKNRTWQVLRAREGKGSFFKMTDFVPSQKKNVLLNIPPLTA